MKTLEEAILDLETWVSAHYREPFPNSELRKNPKGNIEFLKFNLDTLLHANNEKVKETSFENILNIVLDDHKISEAWKEESYFTDARKRSYIYSNGKAYQSYIKDCLNDCDIIIARLAEEEKPDEGMSIKELNDKYRKKILYFNGDENGFMYIYVNDLHMGKEDFEVDGVMIDVNLQNNRIDVNKVENYKLSKCYYFGDPIGKFTADSLDKALQMRPCDSDYPNHVVTANEVFNSLMSTFEWWFTDDYDLEIPELAKIFENVPIVK